MLLPQNSHAPNLKLNDIFTFSTQSSKNANPVSLSLTKLHSSMKRLKIWVFVKAVQNFVQARSLLFKNPSIYKGRKYNSYTLQLQLSHFSLYSSPITLSRVSTIWTFWVHIYLLKRPYTNCFQHISCSFDTTPNVGTLNNINMIDR